MPTSKTMCPLDRLLATVATVLGCVPVPRTKGPGAFLCSRARTTLTCDIPLTVRVPAAPCRPPRPRPLRVVFTPGSACVQVKTAIVLMLVGSLSCLAWSRESKSMDHFRVRHVVWHIASAASLLWLAWVDGTGLHHVPLIDPQRLETWMPARLGLLLASAA